MSQIDRSLAEAARAWPFEEARKLVARTGGKAPAKGYVLFETGYGPSGLPHIGTFGEVVRTTMVRQAFKRLSDIPTRLFCFSDDMDGLRKVPDNVPNKDLLTADLGKPLTEVRGQHLLVRHVVGHLAQPIHVVGERDQPRLDLVVGQHAKGMAHHGGARHLANVPMCGRPEGP